MKTLVINCGSSSIKYRLYEMPSEKLLAKGIVEKIGLPVASHSHSAKGQDWKRECECRDHTKGMKLVTEALMEPEDGVIGSSEEIVAVGHRVVHGGEKFWESVVVDEAIEKIIEELYPLAPLHNPPNLLGIRAAKAVFPHAPHVGVFDTAFHRSLPRHAYLYGIPYKYYEQKHVRKYGFHGTSYRYVTQRVAELMKKPLNQLNLIACHLGNGSSITAVRNGESVDTSMGTTPLEGLIMGTRSGDMDLGVCFHLLRNGFTPAQLDNMLNKESGVLGISGISNDMRHLEQAAATGNERAQLALDCYHYRLRKYIGAYLAALVRVDAVIFTGGIGERGPISRAAVLKDMAPLGIELDLKANDACFAAECRISAPASRTQIWVVPTNEEVMIARDTFALARK